ncbi:unnamed protein product [Closterium sp. NIES-65]|nr:unnamed protein product [Closterium sp. NIES-65]
MGSSFARSAGDFSDGCGSAPAARFAPSSVGGGRPPALSLLLCLLVDVCAATCSGRSWRSRHVPDLKIAASPSSRGILPPRVPPLPPLPPRGPTSGTSAPPPLSNAGLKPLPAGTQGVAIVARHAPVGLPHTIPRPLAALRWGADDIKRACPGGDCSCRSQPRRGPGAPGPSPAPGRLGAGWARSLCFLLAGVAPAAATTAGPSVSPSAWPCPCMLAPAAAAGVSADSAAAGVDGSIGDWSYRPTTSATAAAITGASRVGGDSAPTGAGESASPGSPCNSSAAGPSSDSGSKTKPSSEAAAVPAAGRRDICPNSVESATTATSAPPCSLTPGPTAAASSHKPGLEIGGMLPAEQSAAVAAATEMLHYLPLIGLVQGAPGAALGPGPRAMVRLAESARGSPLGLVSAAASVLRWMDGRLCWILAE